MKNFSGKSVETEELTGIRCNGCGRDLHRNELGYFEDHVSVSKAWGFHSPIDGETHEFDICVDCYRDWIKPFQIPPQVTK